MTQKTETLLPVLAGQPVIPVIRIERVADAVPLARALAKGGLPAIEITLRTQRVRTGYAVDRKAFELLETANRALGLRAEEPVAGDWIAERGEQRLQIENGLAARAAA